MSNCYCSCCTQAVVCCSYALILVDCVSRGLFETICAFIHLSNESFPPGSLPTRGAQRSRTGRDHIVLTREVSWIHIWLEFLFNSLLWTWCLTTHQKFIAVSAQFQLPSGFIHQRQEDMPGFNLGANQYLCLCHKNIQ